MRISAPRPKICQSPTQEEQPSPATRQHGAPATARSCWAAIDEDFTLHYFGRNPLAGVHRGKQAALGILGEVARRTDRKLVGIIDVMTGPERSAVLVRELFARNGKTAEMERLLVYSVRDGLLDHCWVYDRDQSLVDEFLAGTDPTIG